MVHTSILVLAAVAVAPVLSAPLQAPEPVRAGAQVSAPPTKAGPAAQLEARAPEPFKFKKLLRGAAKVASKAARVRMGAAKLLVRDVDGNIYIRELDPADISALEAREPLPFNFKKFISGAAKAGLGAAKLLIRDEDGTVYARVINLDELSAVEAREPFRHILRKKVEHVAREVETSDLLERDLLERDVDLEIDIDTREPRRAIHRQARVQHDHDARDLTEVEPRTVASKVVRVAAGISEGGKAMGLRELD